MGGVTDEGGDGGDDSDDNVDEDELIAVLLMICSYLPSTAIQRLEKG